MIYCFDLDGTICTSVEGSQYQKALPDLTVVKEINRLYNGGHKIIIMTARGCVSGVNHSDLTREQLRVWGVYHHHLIMHVKPHAHLFIDDKAIHIDDWKKQIPQVKGIIGGAFDIIHPGYIKMFKECKQNCTHLTVALHENPSIERISKLSPIHTVEERTDILKSIRYVDDIVVYKLEEEFHNLLQSKDYNIRFLGDDYKDGSYTGKNIPIEIKFVDRNHDYSTTELKRKIEKCHELRSGSSYICQ